MRLDKNCKIRTNSIIQAAITLLLGLVYSVMVHDTHASNTAPEPDSPGDNNISYCDWQSPAGAMIDVSIDRSIWPDALIQQFKHIAPKIFDEILSAHDTPWASVSLRLCDDLQMRKINRQYRKIDRATNVLSFAAIDMPSHNLDPGAPALLGDIIIVAETVTREANSLQIPMADHLAICLSMGCCICLAMIISTTIQQKPWSCLKHSFW